LDNLTHTLLGAALAKSRLGRVSPLAVPAILIAANLPDLDGLYGIFGGREEYLLHHRGFSHSLLGIALLAPLLTLAVRGLERRFRPAPSASAPRRFGPLLVAVFLALLSHPALDFLNTYGIRPGLPFDATPVYGDLVFILDPWLWLIFGGAALLAGPRTRAGNVLWAVLGAAMSWICLTSPRAPHFLPWIWVPAVALLAAGRIRGIGLHRPRRVLLAAAAITVLYLGGLFLAARTAARTLLPVAQAKLGLTGPPPSWSLSPWPADPFGWTLLAATPDTFLRLRFRMGGETAQMDRFPRNLDAPEVRSIAGSFPEEVWRWFARYPIAALEEEPGSRRLWLLDGRYDPTAGPNWSSLTVDLKP